MCSFGKKASSKEHKYKYGRKYDAPSGQGGDIPDSFVSEWLGIHLDATSQSLTLAIFTLNLSATAQEYITLAGTLLEASSVQCDSTLRHMIQIERVHREGSDTAIPSIKPRAFNWNVPWKALRVSDEWMRWLRSLPNTGWVSTTLAAWKHLMAHKLAGRLNFPLALFYDAEERYLVLPAFGQSSCCAGTPGLFYFITFIFLFLYASLSEDSYLSRALLRGKSTTKHKLRDGEWFIASSAALLFPRRSWTQKNSPLRCCRARFRTPAGPQRDTIGWGFWVFYSCLIESRQPHLMISIVLTVKIHQDHIRDITEATHGQIFIFLIFQLACYC